jgi:uncharacterized membrane protein
VALKALSPGVNDTTTAVNCVHYLGAILVRLADRRVEPSVRECGGEVRVLAHGPSSERLVRLACDEIRAAGNLGAAEAQLLVEWRIYTTVLGTVLGVVLGVVLGAWRFHADALSILRRPARVAAADPPAGGDGPAPG